MSHPKQVTEPRKELRFTRAGQAQGFFIAGAVCFALAAFILITCVMGHPSFHWWMFFPPLILGIFSIRLALHCTRHAYLILTPLGIEIFPLRKPEDNLLLIYWSEIDSAAIEDSHLKIHRNREQTSGVIVSLKPILEKQRSYLKKSIQGRMQDSPSSSTPSGVS